VGANYFTVGQDIYLRTPSNFVLTSGSAVYNKNLYPASPRYIATDDKLNYTPLGTGTGSFTIGAYEFKVRNAPSVPNYKYPLGANSVVGCPSVFADNFLDVTSLKMYRIPDVPSLESKDFPVIGILVNDLNKSYGTTITYDNNKATGHPQGPAYNKVTVAKGISSGYTEYYFFNGLYASEVSDIFPQEAPSGNAGSYTSILAGQPYRIKQFNSSNAVVSESTIYWNVDTRLIANTSAVNLTLSYIPRKYKEINVTDGIQTVSKYGYENTYRLVNNVHQCTIVGGIAKEVVEVETTYAWQVYPSLVAKNILTPSAQIKKKINGSTYVESAVSRWKDWTCSGGDCLYASVPSPVDFYAWKGTNSSSFSWWDVATQSPSSDWAFKRRVVSREASTGVELEEVLQGGLSSSSLLNNARNTVVANAINCSLSDIAYCSFEDASQGNWSWSDGSVVSGISKTGKRHMLLGTIGLTKSGMSSTKEYRVSFWAKSTNGTVVVDGVGSVSLGSMGSWKLHEYTISGISSLNIRRSGAAEVQIDEVRLLPVTGRMITQTHHALFGPTSTTDPNNRTIYTEFDDMGRVSSVLDQNGNIVQVRSYNFRK
jgi:hypothetical protein